MRRVAANWVYRDAEQVLRQAVVELSGEYVVNYYPIEDELPATEWLGGALFLSAEAQPELPAKVTLDEVKSALLQEDTVPRYVYHLHANYLHGEEPFPSSFLHQVVDED